MEFQFILGECEASWGKCERERRVCAVSVAYRVGNNRTEHTCINPNHCYSPGDRAVFGRYALQHGVAAEARLHAKPPYNLDFTLNRHHVGKELAGKRTGLISLRLTSGVLTIATARTAPSFHRRSKSASFQVINYHFE